MKNIILLSVLFVIALFESTYGQAELNVSAGINQSAIEPKDFSGFTGLTFESRSGFFIGLSPKFSLKDKLNLSVDFQYSQKGYAQTDLRFTTKFRFSYLDIIPEIEYKIANFLTLGVGVNYGFRVGESFKEGNGGWNKTKEFKYSNSSDFGLIGKIKANFNNIFVFFRYNHGLKDILDAEFTDEFGNIIDGPKFLSRNFQLGAGYVFDLKKK